MKTSNKLIISLLALLFLAILGSAMVLKAEYDKIDQNDPFYGYTSEVVTGFSAVKLQNQYLELVQVQEGDKFEIKKRNAHDNVQWAVQDDTLVLTFPQMKLPPYYSFASIITRELPGVYIITPQLGSVHSQGIICKLKGWQQSNLQLVTEGETGGILLAGNTIEHLSASVALGSTLRINADNQVGQAQVAVRDSSAFVTEYNAIDSLKIGADATARIQLPGSLYSQLAPE
ncbi:MAG: hypothetical protein RIG62_14090 [Cyclobacteriaceae bacterium]